MYYSCLVVFINVKKVVFLLIKMFLTFKYLSQFYKAVKAAATAR